VHDRQVREKAGRPSRWPLGLGIGDGTVVVATEQLELGDRLVYTVLRQLAGGLSGPVTMRRVVRALLEHQQDRLQDRLQDDASLLLAEWLPDSA